MKRKSLLWVTLLMLSASLAWARPAEKPSFDRAERLNEMIVQEAYANLERYTELEAPDFTLEVTDFKHFYPEDFAQIEWLELLSTPDGLLVDMHRETQQNVSLGLSRSIYKPSLRYVHPPYSSEVEELRGQSVDEVLGRIVSGDAESNLANVESITGFEVTATLGTNTRTYRAAFFWVPVLAEAGTDTALVVLDHVTQGVEEAALDPFPALQDRSFLEKRAPSAERPEKIACKATASILDFAPQSLLENHAILGYHRAYARYRVSCSCDAQCNNSCLPLAVSTECKETGGQLSACHKMSSRSKVKSGSDYMNGASCGAGYICAKKDCLFCACSLAVSVTVNVVVGSVTFSFGGGDSNWGLEAEFPKTCPACQVDDVAPGHGDDGGNTGGSGNSGGGTTGGDWGGPGDTGGGAGDNSGGNEGTGGFSVYCNGEYVGEAASAGQAFNMCPEPVIPDPPDSEDEEPEGGDEQIIA